MNPIISTKSGRVRGLRVRDEYVAFFGIPFAKPPLGELRFRAPVSSEPWEGILDATVEKPSPCYLSCYVAGLEASEDCLYLNVFAKNLEMDKKPVIVFVHGGNFNAGSCSTKLYGPDHLLQKDVILVTFNYRLVAQGCLSFKDPSLKIPGNAALKDQRMALKWVRSNIEAFGGNPDNVTAFGHSAGAVSLFHHMASEGSRGLFQRAVLFSGTPLASWGLNRAKNVGEKVARNTGWDGSGGERGAYEHLLKLDSKTLTDACHSKHLLTKEDMLNEAFNAFGPVLEPYESEDSVIARDPVEAMRDCWGNSIDIVISSASNEILTNFDTWIQPAVVQKFVEIAAIPPDLRDSMSLAELKRNIAKVKALYGDFEAFSHGNYKPMLDFRNDQLYNHPTHRVILSRIHHAPQAKTFLCYFNLVSEALNFSKIRHKAMDQPGVAHGDELLYLFTSGYGPAVSRDSKDFQSIQKVVTFLTDFARDGPKMCEERSWDAIRKEDLPYEYKALVMEEPEWNVRALEETQRMGVWDTLYPEGQLF